MRLISFLPPQKITSQNHPQKSPISLSVLVEFKPVMQTDLHPLWNVHSSLECFRVAIFLQQLSLSESRVHCSQSPCNHPGPMCHVALDHSVPEAGAQRGMLPEWDPASRSGLPTIWRLNPWWAWHLPGLTSVPIRVGSKGQDPECPSAPVTKNHKPKSHKPRAQSLHQVPKQDSQWPRAKSKPREWASPHLLFEKSSLLEFYGLQKPGAVPSFPANEGQCWPYLPLLLLLQSC